MLTSNELKQIKDYLALYGKKDSQLSTISTVDNTDYVAIVHNGRSVTITVELLKKAVLEGIISDEEFNDLWDAIPTEDSQKMVRSDGIWHAINDNNVIDTNQIVDSAIKTSKINDSAVTTAKINNDAVTMEKLGTDVTNDLTDLHSKTEKYVVTLSAASLNHEITGSNITTTLTTTSKVTTFGDAGSTDVIPDDSRLTASGSSSISGNIWSLPNTVGSYTATYTATKNNVTRSASVTANVYLRKYFGFSADTPADITELGTSHASASVGCTIIVPVNGTGFKYIYFAVPNNMTITRVIQPDALNAPLAITQLSNVVRTINGMDYTYKLYRSESAIDSSVAKRLTIS